MKVCRVVLRDCAEPGLYRVERFTNTTQLRVGMIVPGDRVAEWCAMKRVNVIIEGKVEDKADDLEQPGLTMQDVQRVDAMQLAGQAMKDTGSGENPF